MRKQSSAIGVTILALLALGPLSASAAGAEFRSANYTASLLGTQVAKHVFFAAQSNIECEIATFSGTLTKPSATLSVAPNYEKCTVGGGEVQFKASGCTYNLEAGLPTKVEGQYFGLFDIVCPVGQRMTFTFLHEGCQVSLRPEKGLDELFFFTTGGNDFKETFAKSNFAYSVNKNCGIPVMEYENGTYSGEATFKGNNGAVAVS